MIIAVDDSGDPGFKLGKGSSEYFVIAAIFFDDDLDAEEAALNIKRLRKSLHWNPSHEFKFRKSSAEIKRLFFEVIAPLNFRAAISIVDKRHFADKTLQRETSKFYNTIILRTLLTNGQFSRAHIYIDGEGGNDYRRKVKTFFRQNLPRNAIRVLTYRDSKQDNLIQIADMVAGAALRSVSHRKTNQFDYLKLIRKHIQINRL